MPRRNRRMPAVLPVVGALLAGCSYGASPDKGLEALLRVASAQYVPGAPPGQADGGPKVSTINSTNNNVHVGQAAKPLDGDVDPSATAMAIMLENDIGYWILPSGPIDANSPDQRLWVASLSLSPLISPGPHKVTVQGVDADEHFGPPSVLDLLVHGDIPDGGLVVSLAWDTEADLDLHVVDPNGIEIWSHKPTDYKPTKPPATPDQIAQYGHLDFDSNASCVIDGRRQENVVWGTNFQAGHYLVRVDTFSLCGQSAARWSVEAVLGGTVIGASTGQSGPTDTRFSHLAGAGVLALQFDVPAPDGGG